MATVSNVRKGKAEAPKNETPSQQLIAKADSAVVIETPNGFSVTLRKPGVLSQFRLVKMLGDSAKNTTYVSMILPVTFVSHVNGLAVSMNSEREIEALISRLDEDGIASVMQGVAEHFGSQADAESVKAEVKN